MTRMDRRTLLRAAPDQGGASRVAPAQAFPALSLEAAALWALVAQNHPWHWRNAGYGGHVPEEFVLFHQMTEAAFWRIGELEAEDAHALSRWALASDDPWFRKLGLTIIEHSKTLEGSMLDELLDTAERLMAADQPYDVRSAALSMASAHWDARPFPGAEAMVDDPDPRLREDALEVVCLRWSDDRLAALARMMRDPDPHVRAAVISLASHAFRDEDRDAMCGLAHDAHHSVRHAVARKLREDAPRSLEALFTLARDENDDVRKFALLTLGVEFDVDSPEVCAVLRGALGDASGKAAAVAAAGLARRRDPSAAAFVAEALRQSSCETATYAAAALIALPEFEADLLRHRDSGSASAATYGREYFDWAIGRCRGATTEPGDHIWFVPSSPVGADAPPSA